MKTAHQVRELMTANPVVLYPENSLHDAWVLFSEHRISGAPVVNRSGVLIGVLSQVDLLREAFSGPFADFRDSTYWVAIPYQENSSSVAMPERLKTVAVEDAMHQGAIAVTATDNIGDAARYMRSERVHRVVVIDHQSTRHVVGILSALDILKLIEEQK